MPRSVASKLVVRRLVNIRMRSANGMVSIRMLDKILWQERDRQKDQSRRSRIDPNHGTKRLVERVEPAGTNNVRARQREIPKTKNKGISKGLAPFRCGS